MTQAHTTRTLSGRRCFTLVFLPASVPVEKYYRSETEFEKLQTFKTNMTARQARILT